jgi:hypothetical protein
MAQLHDPLEFCIQKMAWRPVFAEVLVYAKFRRLFLVVTTEARQKNHPGNFAYSAKR